MRRRIRRPIAAACCLSPYFYGCALSGLHSQPLIALLLLPQKISASSAIFETASRISEWRSQKDAFLYGTNKANSATVYPRPDAPVVPAAAAACIGPGELSQSGNLWRSLLSSGRPHGFSSEEFVRFSD